MKRKLFTFLVAFLATLSGAVWGQDGTFVLSTGTSSGKGVTLKDGIIKIDGTGKYLIKGDGDTYNYRIETNSSPTITLENVRLETSKDFLMEINIIGGGTVNLELVGENVFKAQQIGIRNTVATNLNILGSSTGFLTISAPMCIGNDIGVCGDVNFNGGTVYLNATDVAIGGTPGANVVTVNENAVLVTTKKFSNIGFEIKNGIVYDDSRKSNPGVGIMKGDVTLKSPLPSDRVGDKAVDLQGKTLTLGSGISAELNQIKETTGTLNAYKVEYKSDFRTEKYPLPVTKYYGSDFLLAQWNAGFEQTRPYNGGVLKYAHLENTGWFLEKSYQSLTSIQKENETPQGVKTLTYQAAWYLSEATLNYDVEGFNGFFSLGYPEGLPFAATIDEEQFAAAGLTVKGNQVSENRKATAGKHELTLNYTTPDGATGRIVANVEGGTYDMKDPSQVLVVINPSTAPYKAAGYRQDEIVQVFVSSNDWITRERITEGYSVECNGASFPETGLVNAGKYTITVKANEGSNLTGESPELSFEITPKKVGVTAEPLQWQLGSDPKVEPTFRINWADVFEADIEGVQLAPYTADLSSYTEAGSYSKIYTGVKLVLTGSATGNYYCDPDITGDLVVLEAPITSFDFLIELDEEITYFGGAVDICLQVVYDKDKIAATNEYTATYYKKIGGDWLPMTSAPIHVGEYMVVVKGNGELLQDKEEKADFKITPRPLTVSAQPIEWKQGEDTQKEVMFSITEGLLPIDAETVHVKKMSIDVSDWTPGVYEDVNYSDYKGGVKLGGTAAEDYYIKGSVTGRVSIEAPKPEPSDPKIDVPGWDLTDDGFVKTYDGQSYELQTLKVTVDDKTFTLKEGKDFTLERQGTDKGQIIKDAGVYIFTVEFTDATLYNPAQVIFTVLKRQMNMAFKLPAQIETLAPMAIQADHLKPELQKGKRGLVSGETPLAVAKGQFLFGKPNAENKCAVTVSNFALAKTGKFNPANYRLQIWDAEKGKYVDYDGGDITIIDPEHPDPNNPNEPGDGIVVDPDHGGGEGGQQPSKNFCNIYVAEGSSPFIQFNPSRRVVEAVGQITVDVVIPDEIEMDDVKLTFRRGDGAWEALTMDEVTKKYTIKDINTHIYLKAEVDAVLLDAEPNENHVYIDLSCTKDGIKLDADREIVENGGDVLIKAEVSKENQNKAIKYEYKVTRFGAWKELKASGKAGEFMIWNVTNDIFVRAYLADQAEDPETAKEAHHVYSDLSVTCEGLYLDADRKMVDNNGTTKVYLTIEPNYNAKNAHYMFRRGIHEAWEELTPSTEANVFVITGIESDIYLKGTDAVPTGTEDALSETTRVYTQDGMLYVYTAQQEEVSVISMVGAVVKRTQQTGLQSYPLNQGIYVVRVGEQVFKVRVK